MRISKLEPIPAEKGRWVVRLDDGTALSVTDAEMVGYSLYTGMELEDNVLTELSAAAAESRRRARALDMISARPLSRAELIRKLTGKGGEGDNPEATADWLESMGLLNDAEYARTVARHYAAKGFGLYKVKDELYRRGVPKEFWEDALAELGSPADVIDAFLKSRLGEQAERAQIKKCHDALLRRGFTYRDISDGLKRHSVLVEEN